jgi:D-alanine-D-alanine ligase
VTSFNQKITDAREFGRVAVLMGGASAERAVSLKSGRAVLDALIRQGVDAVGHDVCDNLIAPLLEERFDRVFNIVHGRGGEDGVLQGALEVLKIPYTGSRVLASALSMDKLKTKLCWQASGIPTPRWMVIENRRDLERCEFELGFPVIVKPAKEGSSIGMSRAGNLMELNEAWIEASKYNCTVFAEQWIVGNEYTVSMLQGQALPLIRLETPRDFYDFDAKYQSDSTQYHCPCGLDSAHEERLKDLAMRACQVVDATGWARVDLLVDADSAPWLIEINTVPGMTDHSLVPMAAKSAGLGFDQLVWLILETSISAVGEAS